MKHWRRFNHAGCKLCMWIGKWCVRAGIVLDVYKHVNILSASHKKWRVKWGHRSRSYHFIICKKIKLLSRFQIHPLGKWIFLGWTKSSCLPPNWAINSRGMGVYVLLDVIQMTVFAGSHTCILVHVMMNEHESHIQRPKGPSLLFSHFLSLNVKLVQICEINTEQSLLQSFLYCLQSNW